jgi:hypothetical protein
VTLPSRLGVGPAAAESNRAIGELLLQAAAAALQQPPPAAGVLSAAGDPLYPPAPLTPEPNRSTLRARLPVVPTQLNRPS